MSFAALSQALQYSLPRAQRERLLLAELNSLTARHREHCADYARILEVTGAASSAESLAEVPYLPIGLFKSHRLSSVPAERVFKTLTSSGTTGQQVSQVVLDKETALRQTATLGRIISHIVGPERLPMILIETSAILRDRRRLRARAAGLLGMMNFGRNHFHALDEDMNLDEAGLRAFLERFGGAPFLLFGFTFMVWQYFYARIRHLDFDLSNGILLHSGGWKKLQDQAVTNQAFKRDLAESTGLSRVYNFYGMVEQVGSIHVEGEDGFLYSPNTGDVIIRDPITFAPTPPGTPGVIQVLSALPLSYPGHSILTEDVGVMHGIDDSTCGRFGTRFTVLGRVPATELRGCSDVHAHEAPP